ncbi:hypothetical protein BGW38_001183 [Lunasporangiospora selenospora]|uniref:Uncharacterized protein n=1 Tax=Lunasporangiospora selenospora TaxID=979761 RepID=A0A9P6KHH1_9FUNG|nr:hypothetical protein BGW38_001183 [Lunasporangiospora selenospora]
MVVIDSIVGITGLLLTISSLISPSDVPKAKVRVQIQTGDVSGDSGGHIPSIYLKASDRGDIGSYTNWRTNDKIGTGDYWNIDIETTRPRELALLELTAKWTRYDNGNKEMRSGPLNDGICIAYMSWTPESTMFNAKNRKGAITGDLFYYCGLDWYHSAKTIPNKKGSPYTPRCGWIDGDNSSGNSAYSILLNTDILGDGYLKGFYKGKRNINEICGWGIGFSKGSLPRKRSATETFGNKAYITAGEGAISLCDSATSWGPSMLSLSEGIFCDMETKSKIPLCRNGQTAGCMKYDRVQGRMNSRGRRGPPQRFLAPLNVSREVASFDSYKVEYFTRSYTNGTVYDDGSDV